MHHIRFRYLGYFEDQCAKEIIPSGHAEVGTLMFDSRTAELKDEPHELTFSIGRTVHEFPILSTRIGRDHGHLAYRQGRWFLLNSGSQNSFVDGRYVRDGDQPINDASTVRLGDLCLTAEIVEERADTPAHLRPLHEELQNPGAFWDRIRGGLLGLLIGDALGVPYEFHPPEAIPEASLIEFRPPEGFHGSQDVPPGTWSDDGAQALCLLASLLHKEAFDADDFAQRLCAWFSDGYMAVDNHVFDVGITTTTAIKALLRGVPPLEAGPTGEWDNGNGALMRTLPLALWHRGDDASLLRAAFDQSRVTHGHLRSQLCCGLYCLWAKAIRRKTTDPWEDAVERLRRLLPPGGEARAELEDHIQPDKPPHGTGSGYVVDALHSARLAMQAPNYESVVRSAIQLGLDTDTTACIAGGLAGLKFGVSQIPKRWKAQLRGKLMVEPLLRDLKVYLNKEEPPSNH